MDIDSFVPGFADEPKGAVTLVKEDEGKAYGVVDEITARAFASSAKIYGVNREALSANHELAAILRYAM